MIATFIYIQNELTAQQNILTSLRRQFPAAEGLTREERQRSTLVKLIVDDYLPIDFCTSESYRAHIESHNSSAHHYTTDTIKKCMKEKAIEMKELTKEMVQGHNSAITSDCWTSIANESYIALTAHFIDKDWKLNSLNLSCDPFPGSHKAQDVAMKIVEVHEKNGIPRENISACVMDNEPTNNLAGDFMPYEWIGCIDHLIELTTGIAFDNPAVVSSMAAARGLVGHFCG